MLYAILKIWVRLGAKFFCRRIVVSHPRVLKEKGPLLLACNHPNSFLDSVILDILFEQPLWSLARGDAFRNKAITRFFKTVKMLPVYRASEGVENLSENYKTFEACINIFRQDGLVHIFSEGKCINEWHLRPLKKGTARLAIKAWEENIPLKVLPVGINYSSFTRFGKNMYINFGEEITIENIDWSQGEGLRYLSFNLRLQQQMEKLVFEIEKSDKQKQHKILATQLPFLKKVLLAFPATLGWLLHLPLYLPVKFFVRKRYRQTDHYDSVMAAVLTFSYPVYLLLIILLFFIFFKSWWVFSTLIILPFTAWSCVQLKEQLDR